jgi:hypothetical protein
MKVYANNPKGGGKNVLDLPFGCSNQLERRLLVESVTLASIFEMITIVESMAVLRCSSPCTVRMPDPEKATVHSPSAISATEQRILATYSISPEEIRKCQTKSGSKHLKTAEK